MVFSPRKPNERSRKLNCIEEFLSIRAYNLKKAREAVQVRNIDGLS
jgi:hypothetical protein